MISSSLATAKAKRIEGKHLHEEGRPDGQMGSVFTSYP